MCSCEQFKIKKTSSEAILKEELQTFNWQEVDAYPSFSKCDSLETNEEKSLCFSELLTNHILNYLQQEQIIVSQDINDTINLDFQVSEKGELMLLHSEIDSIVKVEIPAIERLIKESLEALPKIYPAIKRGQQVRTEFNLPIIINVQ